MQIAMVQDKIMPVESLDMAYFDRGLYFGDGVYEVLRSYQGRIFALDEHMTRFSRSLAAVRIHGLDIKTVKTRVLKAFQSAGIADAKIYFHVTRGSAPRDQQDLSTLPPNFLLILTELGDASQEKAVGISVASCPDERWKRCDIKSLNLLPNILARQSAIQQGCQEAILIDEAGLITEGAASCFFAILSESQGLVLCTAPLTANILPSVTRQFVLEAAGIINLPIREQSIPRDRAPEARELFIAVTTRDIVPVVRFDGRQIGTGLPGPTTRRLMETFQGFVAG